MVDLLKFIGGIVILLGVIYTFTLSSLVSIEYKVTLAFLAFACGVMFFAYACIIEHLAAIRQAINPDPIKEDHFEKAEIVDGMLKCPKCGTLNPTNRKGCHKCYTRIQ